MIKYRLDRRKKKEKEAIMRKLWNLYEEDEELLEETIDEIYNDLLHVKYDEDIDEQKDFVSVGLIIASSLSLAMYNSFVEHSKRFNIDEETANRIYSSIKKVKIIEDIGGVKFGKTLQERIRIIDRDSTKMLKNTHSMYVNKDITIGEFINELAVIKDMTKYQYKRLLNTEYAYTINKGESTVKEAIEEILSNRYDIIDKEAWKKHGITKISKEELGVETYKELIDEVGLIRADIKKGQIIEQYIYNAILDSKTCGECESHNGRYYTKENLIPLPQHPNCRCYYDMIYVLKVNNETINL